MTRAVVIIPDLHGRADLLNKAVSFVKATYGPDAHIVSLGDAIDRGPHGAACAETLLTLAQQGRATLLMGNHEHMALESLKWFRRFQRTQDPTDYRRALEGMRWWMANGGDSIRRELGGLTFEHFPERLAEYLSSLHKVLYITEDGQLHSTLPSEPSVLVAHASPPIPHPRYPSPESAALWLRPFDGPFTLPESVKYSVHGHTPTPIPVQQGQHIYLDLGAYKTGKLALLTVSVLKPTITILEGRGNPSAAQYYMPFGTPLPAHVLSR